MGFGALGRAISPYWCKYFVYKTHAVACIKLTLYLDFIPIVVESYERTGRHTYLPMSITIGCLLVLLVYLMSLYKHLAPRVTHSEVKEATNAVSQDLYLSGNSLFDYTAICYTCTWFCLKSSLKMLLIGDIQLTYISCWCVSTTKLVDLYTIFYCNLCGLLD